MPASVMRYRTAPEAGRRAGRALFRTSPIDAKNRSATRPAVTRSSGGQTGSASRTSRIERSPAAASGASVDRVTPVRTRSPNGTRTRTPGAGTGCPVRHEVREALAQWQRKGDRDPADRRGQIWAAGGEDGSSGLSRTKTWSRRSGSQRYRRVASSSTSGVTTMASRSSEMSPSASEMSRSRNTPGGKRPAGLPGEDDDGEPGRVAIGVPPDEGDHEVEQTVVVDVAAHEVGVVDAVQCGHVVGSLAAAPVVVVGRAQVRVRAQKRGDGALFRGPEVVSGRLDARRSLGRPRAVRRRRRDGLGRFPAAAGGRGEQEGERQGAGETRVHRARARFYGRGCAL